MKDDYFNKASIEETKSSGSMDTDNSRADAYDMQVLSESDSSVAENNAHHPLLSALALTSKSGLGREHESCTQNSLAETVRANADVFDADHDGSITQKELTRAVSSSQLDKLASVVAVALSKNYKALSELTRESILWSNYLSLGDLERFEKLAGSSETKSKEQQQLIDGVDSAIKDTIGYADMSDQSPFGPLDQISPKAVNQGDIGDCSFVAVLAGMASNEQGRQMIRDMIKPDGDGYVVTFPDGQTTKIEKPTPAELTLYAHNNGNGTWVAILEKAYGKLLAQAHNGDVLAPQLSANGCEPYDPRKTLTQGKYQHESINPNQFDNEKLHEKLVLMSTDALVMTAGTGPNPDELAKQNQQPKAEQVDGEGNLIPGSDSVNISGFHVYSVERYDAETRTVYLRNPHNGSQLLRMPLDTFRQAFVGFGAVRN